MRHRLESRITELAIPCDTPMIQSGFRLHERVKAETGGTSAR